MCTRKERVLNQFVSKIVDECDTIADGQKIPTALLLTPNFDFHSFGTAARDYFHDMHPEEAHKWYYFDKFKMFLYNKDVSSKSEILYYYIIGQPIK